jgi:hypothetical protein
MRWASGNVSLPSDEQAEMLDINPAPATGDSAPALLDLFRDAGLTGTSAMPLGAPGIPTDRAAVDTIMAQLGSEYPVLAPGADGNTPQPVYLPSSAGDRPKGGWRAPLLLSLAWFLPLAPDGSRRNGRADKADGQRGKKSGREAGPR